jgi:ribosome-binding protein aMBF1 (putative translation factor)
MSKLQKYISDRSDRDPEFKAAYEAETAVMDLIRARRAKGVSQTDMAERLHVSQPYLAQIEGMTKKLNADLLFRYAAELGLSLKVVEPSTPSS